MDDKRTVALALSDYLGESDFETIVQRTFKKVNSTDFSDEGFTALTELYINVFPDSRLEEMADAVAGTIKGVYKGGCFNQEQALELAELLSKEAKSPSELYEGMVTLTGKVKKTYFNAEGKLQITRFYTEACSIMVGIDSLAENVDKLVREICKKGEYNQSDTLQIAQLFKERVVSPSSLTRSILIITDHTAGTYTVKDILEAASEVDSLGEHHHPLPWQYAQDITKLLPK